MRSVAENLPLAGRPDIRRILILKWSALGDVVMATSIMEDIRRAFPEAEIHLNTMPAYAPLFAHDPRFAEVFAIDVRSRRGRLRHELAWLRQVRAGRYDLVIDLQRTDHTRALLTLLWLTGGAPRYRLGNRGGFPYTHPPARRRGGLHAYEQMRSALQAAGIPVHTPCPVLHAGPTHGARVKDLLKEFGLDPGAFVVFLPGSQAAGWLKRWGVSSYQALAGLILSARLADRIVVLGGPDEVEDCRRIAEAGAEVINLNGRMELLEIAPLCEHALAIVANDTGLAHIASAANRPMLVLCGPTDPRRVKPIGQQVRAIQADIPCKSCYAKDCHRPDRLACMQALTPDFVLGELQAMLTGGRNPCRLEVDVIRV